MRIDDFIGSVSQHGFMQQHKWQVFFGRPGANNNRFAKTCQSVTIPSKALDLATVHTYGQPRMIARRQVFGDDFQMEFLCGTDMYERAFFTRWLDEAVDPITNNINYYVSYICDITAKMYNQKGQLRYAVKFYECFPKSVQTQELNQAATDDFLKVTVDMNYRKYFGIAIAEDAPADATASIEQQMNEDPEMLDKCKSASESQSLSGAFVDTARDIGCGTRLMAGGIAEGTANVLSGVVSFLSG